MTPQQLKTMVLALDLATMHHTDDGYAALRAKVRSASKEALAEHAMQEVQRLGQEIEQVPVAIVAVDGVGQIQVGWITKPQHNDKLYTTPPQRTWVRLTISERDVCWRFSRTAEEAMEAVEYKFMEKNT